MWSLIAKATAKVVQMNPSSIPTQLNIQDVIDFALSLIGG